MEGGAPRSGAYFARMTEAKSSAAIVAAVREIPPVYRTGTATENSYYPALRDLFGRLLESRNLPLEVRVATAEQREAGGVDLPDLALYDRGDYASVLVEVKLPSAKLRDLAFSSAQNDQVGRYLARTGVVLVTNVRSVGLLACKPGYLRKPGTPVDPAQRDLLDEVELWASEDAMERGDAVPKERLEALAELLERAVTEFAPIADPASLARILARQARRAKAQLPEKLDTVAPLLADYQKALGLTFETSEGTEFFRSSLIQTAYYGIFAGWTLWWRAKDGTPFEWDRMSRYLKIPFLGELFHEFSHPTRLAELRLRGPLDRAAETLDRVDTEVFFARFPVASLASGGADAQVGALTYFYEPFLEAFDPELRKGLGVWYTPPEIVRYQVHKVDRLLREELGCSRGLADDRVVVLDPCCGTGAYLLEVLRCIANELRARGEGALLPPRLRDAVTQRIIGFEILTAPFVISQLQIYLALAELGAEPPPDQRPAVFLTNALTGWEGPEQIKLNFPELQVEHDSATRVKRDARIIVVLGNPPYNRFAGAAVAEEEELVDHYKGAERVEKKNRKGEVVRGPDGRPLLVQKGDTLLYSRWGISKQLLDDLYIRFFRLAEKRIGEKADYGIVSFISNSSYLTGRSHPIMRESILSNFHDVWIDNMNGDKYRTGKVIPDGRPGAGSSDQSVFSTDPDPRGIQVGTCISTFLKRKSPKSPPAGTRVHYRDFWGRADAKRTALLESLALEVWTASQRAEAAERPEGPRDYEMFHASGEARWRFAPGESQAGYEEWPGLEDLFPLSVQGVNPNRGLDQGPIDVSADALTERMRSYLGADSFEAACRFAPALGAKYAGFDPSKVWTRLRERAPFDAAKIVPYLLFPLDTRFIYIETEERLLNRPRPEFVELLENEFLVAVPQPRRISETRPLISRTLVDLHAHDRGSVCFPRDSKAGALVSDRVANLAPSAWSTLRSTWGLGGERASPAARELVGQLFRCALALLHSPQFENDHRDALSHDWAHLAIPRDRKRFERLAALGDQIATLLDPLADAEATVESIVGAAAARKLGVLRTAGTGAPDLRVTYAYFGAAKGRWVERDYAADELANPAWGQTTGDLYLNPETSFSNVPARVMEHELGATRSSRSGSAIGRRSHAAARRSPPRKPPTSARWSNGLRPFSPSDPRSTRPTRLRRRTPSRRRTWVCEREPRPGRRHRGRDPVGHPVCRAVAPERPAARVRRQRRVVAPATPRSRPCTAATAPCARSRRPLRAAPPWRSRCRP